MKPTLVIQAFCALTALFGCLISPLKGDIIISFEEVGDDVVATTTGSLVVPDTFSNTFNFGEFLLGDFNTLLWLTDTKDTDRYVGGTNAGNGLTVNPTSASGPHFGFDGQSVYFDPGTPVGSYYSPGTTWTWATNTLAGIGLGSLTTTPEVAYTTSAGETISFARAPEPPELVIVFGQVDGDVVATTTGGITVPDTFSNTFNFGEFLLGGSDILLWLSDTKDTDRYVGGTNAGSGLTVNPTSASGPHFGFDGVSIYFDPGTPVGSYYSPGTTWTWADNTLSGIGLGSLTTTPEVAYTASNGETISFALAPEPADVVIVFDEVDGDVVAATTGGIVVPSTFSNTFNFGEFLLGGSDILLWLSDTKDTDRYIGGTNAGNGLTVNPTSASGPHFGFDGQSVYFDPGTPVGSVYSPGTTWTWEANTLAGIGLGSLTTTPEVAYTASNGETISFAKKAPEIVICFEEIGDDVVATTTGRFIVPSTFSNTFNLGEFLLGDSNTLLWLSDTKDTDRYIGGTNAGNGLTVNPTSASGPHFGFDGQSVYFDPGTPVGSAYSPGTTWTWEANTLAGIGLGSLTTEPEVAYTASNGQRIAFARKPDPILTLTPGAASGTVELEWDRGQLYYSFDLERWFEATGSTTPLIFDTAANPSRYWQTR